MARMTSWREWTGSPLGLALLWTVAVACGLAVAVQFPREPRARSAGLERSALEREAASAKRHYLRAWSGARTVQMRDSLRALARPGLTIVRDPRLSRERAERFEERVRAAWAPFGVTRPRVPVVLALSATTNPSAARPSVDPIFTALPTADGEPCIMVFRERGTWRAVERDARWMRQTMFGCALFAQHGYPGAGVQDEFRRVGWAPSALQFQRYAWRFSFPRTTLGAFGMWDATEGYAYIACSAGKREGCLATATMSSPRSRHVPRGVAGSGARFSDLSLLALIRSSLPPSDYDRLWRDDRPFPVAVADITGRPIDDWSRQALLRVVRPLDSTFSPTSPIVGRALLFFLIAVAAGVVVQVRRTVV